MTGNEREFEVIVWGATGFTGRLVAAYLAQRYGCGAGLNWAVAARNAGKLERLSEDLEREFPQSGIADVPRLIADSDDLDSLRALAQRTRVLISTVGPYALYGSKLIQACAESGTDYCDLAGEPQWIQRMIRAWERKALETGARLVHCCGFDSVPFDMGVWHLQQEMQQRHGAPAHAVRGCVRRIKGSFSGGTFASMLNFVEEAASDPAIRRSADDPNALLPAAAAPYPRAPARAAVEYDSDLNTWTAPFVMAAINTKIVRRSNALLGYPWGKDFRYDESIITGTGFSGQLRALALHAGLSAFMLGAALAPGRALLRRLLPEPGEGPSPETQRQGYYEIVFMAQVPDDDREVLQTCVRGDRDPGYGSTSKMLAECGLCLALDNLATPGGSWTPASAMGGALLKRLQANAGLSYEVL